MSSSNKSRQDDQDNDGIADDKQRQVKANPEVDESDQVAGDGESRVQSNPIIINH